jgi:biopolymer transport protein ExbD
VLMMFSACAHTSPATVKQLDQVDSAVMELGVALDQELGALFTCEATSEVAETKHPWSNSPTPETAEARLERVVKELANLHRFVREWEKRFKENCVIKPRIEVTLPGETSKADQNSTLVVVITVDGDLSLDGKPISKADLTETLRKKVGSQPDISLVIQPDERTPHGRVVEIMDIAKSQGIKELGIATNHENSSQE